MPPRKYPSPSSFPSELADIFKAAHKAHESGESFTLQGTLAQLTELRHQLYKFRKALSLDTKNPNSQHLHSLISSISLSIRAPDGTAAHTSNWRSLKVQHPGDNWTLTTDVGRSKLLTSIFAKNPHFRTAEQRFAERLAAANTSPSDPSATSLLEPEPEEPSEFASTLSDYFKPENL